MPKLVTRNSFIIEDCSSSCFARFPPSDAIIRDQPNCERSSCQLYCSAVAACAFGLDQPQLRKSDACFLARTKQLVMEADESELESQFDHGQPGIRRISY